MNKILAFVIMSLLSINVFATPIPQANLASYQKAVGFALRQKPVNCSFTPINVGGWAQGDLAGAIKGTASGDLNANGAQPLLTFSNATSSMKYTFYVTTSADYKSVVSVNFEQKTCETSTRDVNLGDLANPDIVSQTSTECTVTITAVCQ
jgi:hypothetical protein